MSMQRETVAAIVRDAIAGNVRPAYRVKRNGTWQAVGWEEVDRRIREIGNGLLALGVEPGERVALLSQTRLEWTICDFAAFSIGAVVVPIYPSSSARDVAHVLRDSAATTVICEDAGQLAKLGQVSGALPAARRVVVIEAVAGTTDAITLDRLAARGVAHQASHPTAFDDARDNVRPDDVMTVIYTSGTTGPAKGCILLHRNYAAMTRMLENTADLLRPGDQALMFLPLAHTFARLIQFGGAAADVTICFAESVQHVADNLQELNPELFPTVPRVLEKMHAAISTGFEETTGPRRRIVRWALEVGTRVSDRRRAGLPISGPLRLQHRVADRLVYSKVKARLGGKIRFIVSGGAPLAQELAEFFHRIDLQVLEGYGLTEATTAITLNRPHRYRLGSVGPAFSGCDLRIADDGEIECRGPTVFAGYHGDADATRAALNGEWLRTGDVGQIDDDGFLYITDRKKDLIITAGGKNVAPQNVENLLKQRQPVSQVVVIGDRRPYVSALVTIDEEALQRARPGAEPGDDVTRELVQEQIEAVNAELSHHEQIRRFAILPKDFSQETGELTPTLKVKRRVILERHAETIESLYTAAARP